MSFANARKRSAPVDPVNSTTKRRRQAPPTSISSKRLKSQVHNSIPTQRLRIYVFGDETSGELGLGSITPREYLKPRHNRSLDGVVGIDTGGMHAAALTADGNVLTWGVNDHFALGRDTTWNADAVENEDIELNPHEATPTITSRDEIPEDVKFVQVAACDSATFFLAEDGTVYGCGTFRNSQGILGFSVDFRTHEFTKLQKTPRLISGVRDIVSLAAGRDFILALDNHGLVYAWGDGQASQLGRRLSARASPTASLIPMQVSIPKSVKIVSIHTGSFHAFAIDTIGDVWTWGLNNRGQTGITSSAGQDNAAVVIPTRVPSLIGRKMKMICGGQHHSIAVTGQGECLVFGRMDSAQLGIQPSQLPIDDPTKVMLNEAGRPAILLEPAMLPIEGCVYVAAGSDHSFAITEHGSVYSWGFNDGGQCGQGTDEDVNPAKLMNGTVIGSEKAIWAGAGGRYGMLAMKME